MNLVRLLQKISKSNLNRRAIRLTIVTYGLHAVCNGDKVTGIEQSLIYGIQSVIATEYPWITLIYVDLDPAQSSAKNVASLYQELISDPSDYEIAYRHSMRWVKRVKPMQRLLTSIEVPASEQFKLISREKGTISSLIWKECPRIHPGFDEVEIEVKAAGLNFMDVLDALDQLPFSKDWYGGECVGRVVATGKNVTEFKVGDFVFGFAFSSFAKYVITKADLIQIKPDYLSDFEAATIPSCFLTAYYALVCIAKVSYGDRVLVHAGAGGVGLAAIQILQQLGAEIFTTSAKYKWPVLQEQWV